MPAIAVFVAALVVVSAVTHQFWLLPVGLLLGGVGLLLTSAR
ncbi:MAG: hypothetical protein ACRDL2_04890 [Gaiellaceae bacterium]